MKQREYQVCVRCVMDTSDPEIDFDADGVCNHCRTFDAVTSKNWFPNDEGRRRLEQVVATIREQGKDQEYDSIIGLSGGIDSSYLAYVAVRELGLRPLAVHVDAGWNSDQAVRNIESIIDKLGIDLVTNVIDWEVMKDLQVAYLRSGVENQDTPQDHIYFASLYRFAVKNRISWVLSGSNIATESVLPKAWGYNPRDTLQLRSIHKRFGSGSLDAYPMASIFENYFYWPKVKRLKVVAPLDFMPYNSNDAKVVLAEKLDWRDYGGKHYESRFTKFFQSYWLPAKFGYDKRRAHLSSMVLSGQLTRDQALEELSRPAYDLKELAEDKDFVRKKLGLSEADFEAIMAAPPRTFRDYPSFARLRDIRDTMRRLVSLHS